MTRPFEGLQVLDFTQVLAGPYATFQFALMGADVIKVERREGEDLRYLDMRRTPTEPAARAGADAAMAGDQCRQAQPDARFAEA